jgi:hypothetical protein
MVQAEHGWPREISAWDKNKSVYGKVMCLAGPWRTSGDWWREDAWARDEWDVAIQSTKSIGSMPSIESRTSVNPSVNMPVKIGRNHESQNPQVLYRIYRELSSGTWFVEGVYD